MERLADIYRTTFGAPARAAVRSPLRICPLGAHVDHQGGVVTGLALDASVDFAFGANDRGEIRVVSLDFDGVESFPLDAPPPPVPAHWGNYLRGAARSLARGRRLARGIDGVVRGSLPIGGLSSSAAVTTAYLMALARVNGIDLTPHDLIQLGHWVEREFIGLNNGILDQASNVLCRDGFLMRLDCRTETADLAPRCPSMPPFEVAIVHSGITTPLIRTDYNKRVEECRMAAERLLALGGIASAGTGRPTLRDVPPEVYGGTREALPETLRRRADHYFSEIDRVEQGVAAWRRGDLAAIGERMAASGASSIRNYECGCPELVSIYETLSLTPGVYGARFSGAGYRGACIGLVEPGRREAIAEAIRCAYPAAHPAYKDRYGVFFAGTGDGARIVPL